MSETPPTSEGLNSPVSRQSAILQTLIDISRIITTSHHLDETLENTVQVVAESLAVDVCSIYIHDSAGSMLELRATHGLSKDAVGKVRMPVNEGLIGYVFEQKRHVNVRDVSKHARFKYFPHIDEERLSSFLGVPLIEFRNTLGVLVVQNQENRLFTREEENLLITIASQISGLVSKALLVDRLQEEAGRVVKDRPPGEPHRIQGVPIAPGLASERVVILHRRQLEEPEYETERTPEEEWRVFERAVEESEQEIIELIEQVSVRVNEQEAAIFHSHLLFLEDRSFIGKIHDHVDEGSSSPWAVTHVVQEYLKAFQAIGDPYLKERAADLEDVGLRLLHHLGLESPHRDSLDRAGVLVAEMLLPSDTAQLDPSRIKGIITSVGGHVSHAAILARSLRIPAVSGIHDIFSQLSDGELVMVDGDEGVVYVNPDPTLAKEVERYQKGRQAYLTHLADLREVPCITRCGTRLILRANVSLNQDLKDCREFGAEGVGIYRTEAFYLMRSTRPSVEDLARNYAQVLKVAGDQSVTFRTLDMGGERSPTYLNFPSEANPYLGSRSIRYQLRHPELLRDQFLAILEVATQANSQGSVRVTIPMISQLSELLEVKRVLEQSRETYARSHGRDAPEVPLGMIFEVPRAIMMSEIFMGELDFANIGANDLTQYMLAVDRNNPHVSHLFDPLDPAVLQMIKRVIDSGHANGKPVLLTGELASDPEGCLVLAGLGLREFSLNAPVIPIMKDRFAQFSLDEMQRLAEIALSATSAENVRRNILLFQRGLAASAG